MNGVAGQWPSEAAVEAANRVSRSHGARMEGNEPVHCICACGARFTDTAQVDADDQWHLHVSREELRAGYTIDFPTIGQEYDMTNETRDQRRQREALWDELGRHAERLATVEAQLAEVRTILATLKDRTGEAGETT